MDQLTTSILQTRVMEMVAQVAECIRPEVVLRIHAACQQLAHNVIWNLMACRVRLESIGRSSLANPTAQLRADQFGPCG